MQFVWLSQTLQGRAYHDDRLSDGIRSSFGKVEYPRYDTTMEEGIEIGPAYYSWYSLSRLVVSNRPRK